MKKLLLSAILFIAISMNAQPVSIGLIGGAAGGWCDTCDLALTTTDNTNYTLANVSLTTGQLKFREIINGVGSWGFQIGTQTQPGWPSGTGMIGGNNQDILAIAGVYNIAVNRITGVYSFVSTVTFNTLNITGTAVGATPIALSTSNGTDYFFRGIELSTGNLTINQTNPTAFSWSGTMFPSGIAMEGTTGIPVQAGRYNVAFNITSGAYSFNPVIYTIIGNGVGGWSDNDEIALSSTDGINYSLASVTIGVAGGDSDVKFRENNGWPIQIGNAAWPSGTGQGTSNDPNIVAVPGTYSVTLNRLTKEYNFATLSNENFTKYNFDFYPNPTTNVWNFKSASNVINAITVVNALGKIVISTNPNSQQTTIDASSLSTGIYFARVTSDNRTQSVKLIKN